MERLARAGLFSLWIGGKPVPASRPRVSRWGTYYAKTYVNWMKDAKPWVDACQADPSDAPIALLIETICPPMKRSDATTPVGDVDNYGKGPMDLLTKAQRAWLDDRQVTFLTVAKRFAVDGEEPGFKLWWCTLEG